MLQKLFGMKADRRQALYEAFCALPAFVRSPVLHVACRAGRRHVRGLPTPPRLIWHVTTRCNARCAHCFHGGRLNGPEEMPADDFRRVVASLRVRLRSVTLTGGEPFLRDDLPALCRILADVNRTDLVTLPTNGLQPERIADMLDEILRTATTRINVQVSLDGPPDVHDALREVPGAFERAARTVRLLGEMRTRHPRLDQVAVMTTLSARNQDRLPELVRFVRDDLGAFHKFQWIRGAATDAFGVPAGALGDLDPLQPDKPGDLPGVLRYVRAEILGRDRSLAARRQVEILEQGAAILAGHGPTVRCLAGRVDGVIFADGGVALCEMSRPFARLADWDFDFFRLWHGPEARSMREALSRCHCTHPCNLSTSMAFEPAVLMRLSAPPVPPGAPEPPRP